MGKRRLIPVGFYREFRAGKPHEPSIQDAVGSDAVLHVENIVTYLRDGEVFVGNPGVVKDVLDPKFGVIGAPHILTDGVYAWPAIFAHYVERYRIQPPPEFVRHMSRNGWKVPQGIDLASLELVRDVGPT